MPPQKKLVKKKAPTTRTYEYSELTPEDQKIRLTALIKDLESQHYLAGIDLINIRAVADNHEPDEIEAAVKGRELTLADLELQIARLKAEREKIDG